MIEKTKRCEHCGASLKIFWRRLTPGLVSALVEAIKYVHGANKNEFHLQKHLPSLTKTQYNNFQKLRFHALVAKIDGKAGYWLITARGGEFLRGERAVPMRVSTFRNKVVGHSEETVHISSLKNRIPEFESQFAYEYPRNINHEPQNLFEPKRNTNVSA